MLGRVLSAIIRNVQAHSSMYNFIHRCLRNTASVFWSGTYRHRYRTKALIGRCQSIIALCWPIFWSVRIDLHPLPLTAYPLLNTTPLDTPPHMRLTLLENLSLIRIQLRWNMRLMKRLCLEILILVSCSGLFEEVILAYKRLGLVPFFMKVFICLTSFCFPCRAKHVPP